jgi:hypothetical protein
MIRTRGLLAGIVVIAFGCIAFGAPPVANDDSATTDEDTFVLVDVLVNDSNPDGDLLTIASVSDPEHGTASIGGNQIRYTPDPDYCGTDSFSYTVSDGADTDTAQVTVTVLCINDAPVVSDQLLATSRDTPLSFTLSAQDPDIDPFDPEQHPLVFTIISGPTHGVISGDLTAVIYEPPNTGFVEVTYTPATGFLGTDSITFSVLDPFGASATAVVQIDVDRRRVAVSGTWDASITFEEGRTFAISAFSSTLTESYRIGSFRMRGSATWTDAGWTSLRFNADFPVEDIATVRTTLAFAPTNSSAFRSWQIVTRFSLFDVDFTHTLHLPQSPSVPHNQIVARGHVRDLSFTSTTKLTGMGLAFDEEQLRCRWRWPDCDLSLDARLGIECEGFDEFSLTIREIPVFCPDLLGFGIYLRLETTFTTSSKTLNPTFTCKSDWFDCLKILCELVKSEDATTIEGISLYGVKFRTSFFDGIELRMDTSFVEKKNASVTGYSKYFEVWRLFGPTTSCCGSGGRWQIETYFECNGSQLFNWGMTRFKLDTSLSDQVRLSTRFEFRSDDPIWEWDFGWKVIW